MVVYLVPFGQEESMIHNAHTVDGVCGIALTAFPQSAAVLRRMVADGALRALFVRTTVKKACLLDEFVARLFPVLDDLLCMNAQNQLTNALEEDVREALDIFIARTAIQEAIKASGRGQFDTIEGRQSFFAIREKFVLKVKPPDHETQIVDLLIKDALGLSGSAIAKTIDHPYPETLAILRELESRGIVVQIGNQRSSRWVIP